MKSLDQFLEEENTREHAAAVSALLKSIVKGSVVISKKVGKAGLLNITGEAGATNVQGESQKKLDVIANDVFIEAFGKSGVCCGIASEENDEIIPVDDNAQYVVCMDPLDGSSNIDVNVSIGTIFSVFKRKSSGKVTDADFLQAGIHQVLAGYVIYGSSTMLVFSTGKGVNGFTLDAEKEDFFLSNPGMKAPRTGAIYSLNQGNCVDFPKGVQHYISYCSEKDKATQRPYSLRYIGSLVADFHRNLLKGGIFIYPPTEKAPDGKLRLLYECNPIAFIAEQAGGKAFSQHKRILDIHPVGIHQRVSLIVGSAAMVDKALEFLMME